MRLSHSATGLPLALAALVAGGMAGATDLPGNGAADCDADRLAELDAIAAAADAFADALAGKIGQHWQLADASQGAQASRVVVRVCLSETAEPVTMVLIESDGPSPYAVDELYASARRAILRAHADGGLPLPADQYDAWHVLDLVFDARGMQQR